MHDLYHVVAALMREAGDRIVMPRFRTLSADDIVAKAPGDWVTIADRESEAWLSHGLAALLSDSRVIGEEAVAEGHASLDDIANGTVWVIDPLDGTNNFAEGKRPFAIMVALLNDGICQAGWILDPAMGRLCHAVRGRGSWIDGKPTATRSIEVARPVAAIALHFLSPDDRAAIERRAVGKLDLVAIPRCAGEQYARLASGENDVALFEKDLPWDHLAGALMLEEGGGKIARCDGSPYYVKTGSGRLLAAGSSVAWDIAYEALGSWLTAEQ